MTNMIVLIVGQSVLFAILYFKPSNCFQYYSLNTKINIPKNNFKISNSKLSNKLKINRQLKVSKNQIQMGVEHLVECRNMNSHGVGISSGYLNYDMCLDHDASHVWQMLFVDMFQSMVTIGILVATYFYFRRLAVTDPVNSSFVPNPNINMQQTNDDDYEFNQQCPKCNGTGRNLFSKGMACDLCGGTGEIDIPKPRTYSLPSKKSRNSYEYNDDTV